MGAMTDEPNDKPKKIFIDEDWKSRVQAEKEELRHEREKEESPEAPDQPQQPAAEGPLPPPSLEFLASTLAMQAMVSMGLMAHPASGKPEVHLDEAKHFIDTIGMLQEKTEGNRTPEETSALDQLLHELRMGYVAVQGGLGTSP